MNWTKNISDSDLCDIVHCSISDTSDDCDNLEEIPNLTKEEKVVAYVWGIGGFVDTNGFGGLWSLDIDYDRYAEALTGIQREDMAKAVLESLKVFGTDPVPLDGYEVEQYFGGDQQVKAAAEPYQNEYWAGGDPVKELAAYIRNRPRIFSTHLKQID